MTDILGEKELAQIASEDGNINVLVAALLMVPRGFVPAGVSISNSHLRRKDRPSAPYVPINAPLCTSDVLPLISAKGGAGKWT